MIPIVVSAFFTMLNRHYKTKLIRIFLTKSQEIKKEKQKMKLLNTTLFAASTNATMTASEASLADIKRWE